MYGLNHSKIFYDTPPKIMKIKPKMNKWDLNTLKNFCIANHKQGEKITLRMGEIITNETTDKGLIPKYTANKIQYQKNKQLSQKKAKELTRLFSKEDIQMANKHMKRCSILLIIREMTIKHAKSYQLTPVRQVIIKKSTNTMCWRKGNSLALLVGL